MMHSLRDPNVVIGALLAGITLGSLEFVRPGWVIPGVAGAALFMIGLAGLSQHSLSPAALGILVLSVALVTLDLWLRWGGFGAIPAAVLLVLSLRFLIAPPVHWGLAGLGGILALGLWRVLAFAVQARANKMR